MCQRGHVMQTSVAAFLPRVAAQAVVHEAMQPYSSCGWCGYPGFVSISLKTGYSLCRPCSSFCDSWGEPPRGGRRGATLKRCRAFRLMPQYLSLDVQKRIVSFLCTWDEAWPDHPAASLSRSETGKCSSESPAFLCLNSRITPLLG